MKSFGHLATAPNSFSMNPRIPPRVRFVAQHERIQIDTSTSTSFAQELYNECFTSPSSPNSESANSESVNSDDLNSIASSGFDYLPRAPAQTLILKCTNPDQLALGSCYF